MTRYGLILHAFCYSLLISVDFSQKASVIMQMLIRYLFASRRKKENLKNICSLHRKLGKLLIQLDQTDFTIKNDLLSIRSLYSVVLRGTLCNQGYNWALSQKLTLSHQGEFATPKEFPVSFLWGSDSTSQQ